MTKHKRLSLGYLSMFIGLSLIVFAGLVSGDSGFSSASKGVTATVSGVAGGVLTFVVSRRLLSSPDE